MSASPTGLGWSAAPGQLGKACLSRTCSPRGAAGGHPPLGPFTRERRHLALALELCLGHGKPVRQDTGPLHTSTTLSGMGPFRGGPLLPLILLHGSRSAARRQALAGHVLSEPGRRAEVSAHKPFCNCFCSCILAGRNSWAWGQLFADSFFGRHRRAHSHTRTRVSVLCKGKEKQAVTEKGCRPRDPPRSISPDTEPRHGQQNWDTKGNGCRGQEPCPRRCKLSLANTRHI